MNARAFHAKRKESDELVLDLLSNVSLSPSKRVRLAGGWVPSDIWNPPVFGAPKETPLPALSAPDPTLTPPPPVVKGTDEKALVLYKPINPPLFPGGPPSGSSELPIRVNTAGFLAACKGTDNNGIFTNDAGHSSSAFSNSSPDSLSGTGLFEALDLSGGPASLSGPRRLHRVSSCSSLPHPLSFRDDMAMEEDSDPQPNKQLALIPWAPPTFPMPPFNGMSAIKPSAMATAPGVSDNAEEMAQDGEAMDIVDEVIDGAGGDGRPGAQFGSPIASFGAPSWETHEMFKPPYSKVMWSH